MYPKLLIADSKNRIFEVDGIVAAGMKTGNFYPLEADELIPLPYASELFVLKDRIAVGFPVSSSSLRGHEVPEAISLDFTKYTRRLLRRPDFVVTPRNDGSGECYPIAAFISPGYTVTHSVAYKETKTAKLLPLFSYAAVCWYNGKFYAAAVRIERQRRQDLRLMNMPLMHKNIKRFKKLYSKNRLIKHLSVCAAVYGCPAATNFFLGRFECPLPSSPSCNSACIGCISVKHSKTCPAVQPRIEFVPSPREIAEVALHHINVAVRPVVSFGQGCEGEPLIVAETIERAVKLIRKETKKGIINLNTNASSPKKIKKLREAGLDSIRVSMNSVRERFYNMYYKPRNYTFADVMSSIKIMKNAGGFVSINYLVMPGFTDHRDEVNRLFDFIKNTKIDMIQWRNLNYDPMDYFRKMKISAIKLQSFAGVRQVIEETKMRFPKLKHGYFNPGVL